MTYAAVSATAATVAAHATLAPRSREHAAHTVVVVLSLYVMLRCVGEEITLQCRHRRHRVCVSARTPRNARPFDVWLTMTTMCVCVCVGFAVIERFPSDTDKQRAQRIIGQPDRILFAARSLGVSFTHRRSSTCLTSPAVAKHTHAVRLETRWTDNFATRTHTHTNTASIIWN